jgi:hypothetical protein
VDCINYFYDPQFSVSQRLRDGYALVNVHRDGLLGDPTVLVLEYLKRCLGIARSGGAPHRPCP